MSTNYITRIARATNARYEEADTFDSSPSISKTINSLRKEGRIEEAYEQSKVLITSSHSKLDLWESRAVFWTLAKIIPIFRDSNDLFSLNEARNYLRTIEVEDEQQNLKRTLLGGEDLSSATILRLRREGKLPEAFEKVKKLIPSKSKYDDWDVNAIYYVSIDLLKTSGQNPVIFHECKDALRKILPQISDNKQRQWCEYWIDWDPIQAEIKSCETREDYEGAINLYCQWFSQSEITVRAATSLAWTIDTYIRKLLEEKKINVQAVKRALNFFCKYCSKADSSARSAVLNHARIFAKKLEYKLNSLFKFAVFFMMWGPDRMQEEWEPRTYENKKLPPLAIDLFSMAANQIVDLNDRELAYKFIPHLERAIEDRSAQKDSQWLFYRLSQLLSLVDRKNEAIERLRKVVEWNATSCWVWKAMGDLYLPDDEKAVAFWCKAINCPGDDEFKIKSHRQLLEYFIRHGINDRAKVEAILINNLYSSNEWKIKEELQSQINTALEYKGDEVADNTDFYKSHCKEAEATLFEAYPWINCMVTDIYVKKDSNKKKASILVSSDTKLEKRSISYNLLKECNIDIGDVFQIKGKLTDKGVDIFQIRQNGESAKWSLFKDKKFIINGLDNKKNAVHLLSESLDEVVVNKKYFAETPRIGDLVQLKNSKFCKMPDNTPTSLKITFSGLLEIAAGGYGFADDYFIPAYLIESNNLKNDDEVSGMAMKRYDKSKSRWSYSAYSVKKLTTDSELPDSFDLD